MFTNFILLESPISERHYELARFNRFKKIVSKEIEREIECNESCGKSPNDSRKSHQSSLRKSAREDEHFRVMFGRSQEILSQ